MQNPEVLIKFLEKKSIPWQFQRDTNYHNVLGPGRHLLIPVQHPQGEEKVSGSDDKTTDTVAKKQRENLH